MDEASRLRVALTLQDFGIRMLATRLRREHGNLSAEELAPHLAAIVGTALEGPEWRQRPPP